MKRGSVQLDRSPRRTNELLIVSKEPAAKFWHFPIRGGVGVVPPEHGKPSVDAGTRPFLPLCKKERAGTPAVR